MPIPLAVAVSTSDALTVLAVVVAVALVVGAIYVPAARKRARSRREHADVSSTGRGAWDCVIDVEDVERFIPDVTIGIAKSVFLLSEGVPVRLEVDDQGLRLRISSRLLKRQTDRAWAAPWAEVASAESRPVGFKSSPWAASYRPSG